MSILEWDGSLAIGHEKIDAQHKSLVELINDLHVAYVAGGGHSDLKPVLMALYKYTLFHFSEEEVLMRQAEYKFREEHMLAHSEFIRKLDALAGSVKASNDSIGMETFTWLVGWLLDHISVTDQKLAECLHQG